MDFWNEQADHLEKILLNNAPTLLLHFLRTAPPERVASLAGQDFVQASNNTRAAVTATLTARLGKQVESPTAR